MSYTTFTYDTLGAALQRHLEDDFTDFVTEIPTIISLGETRLLKDLDLGLFDTTDTTGATAVGINQLTKPAGTISIQWIRIFSSALEPRTLDWLQDYAVDTDQNIPRYYAEESDTTIRVAPSPDQAYPVTVRINKRPAGLSTANQTTWLSTITGDVLFAACMVEAEMFARALDEFGVWRQRYGELLQQARAEHRDLMRRTYRPSMAQPAVLPAAHNRQTA